MSFPGMVKRSVLVDNSFERRSLSASSKAASSDRSGSGTEIRADRPSVFSEGPSCDRLRYSVRARGPSVAIALSSRCNAFDFKQDVSPDGDGRHDSTADNMEDQGLSLSDAAVA